MERERGRGDAEPLGDSARRKSGRAGFDQQAEEREARVLGERREGGDDGGRFRFQSSNNIDLTAEVHERPAISGDPAARQVATFFLPRSRSRVAASCVAGGAPVPQTSPVQ
jgi:hypothetical protein